MNKQRKSTTNRRHPPRETPLPPVGQPAGNPGELDFGWFQVSKEHPEGKDTDPEIQLPNENQQPACHEGAEGAYERINNDGIIHVAPPPVTYDENIVMDWPISNVAREQLKKHQPQDGGNESRLARATEIQNPSRCQSRAIPPTPMPPVCWQGYAHSAARPTYAAWREDWHTHHRKVVPNPHHHKHHNNSNNNNNNGNTNNSSNETDNNNNNNNNNSVYNPCFDGQVDYRLDDNENILVINNSSSIFSNNSSSSSSSNNNDYFNSNNHLKFNEYNLAAIDVDMLCSVQPFLKGVESLNNKSGEGTFPKRCDSPGCDCLREFPMTLKEEETGCSNSKTKPGQSRHEDTPTTTTTTPAPDSNKASAVRTKLTSFVHWAGWAKLKPKTNKASKIANFKYSKLDNDRHT